VQWVGSDDYAAYRSGFQFDLSAIPPSAAVTAAKFGLWNPAGSCIYTSTGACGARSHTLNVHQMTKAWTPDVTTLGALGWNTTASSTYTLPIGAGNNWMTWDITTLAKSWVSGAAPNHGMLVKRATEPLDVGGPEVPTDTWYGDPTLRPKLEITYTSNAVRLHEPETLHGNGADLRWDRWEGDAGVTFSGYEIHRAAGTGFTPSASTRVASISDLNTTTYRDTTAAPSSTFTYKIVSNGDASVGRTVALPAAGQARKVLQPDAERGTAAFIDDADGSTSCANYGRDLILNIGNDTYRERSLLNFDLRDIPAGASVASATLSAHLESSPTGSLTVGVHRATAGWTEGTSDWGDCTGDGASWAHRSGGVRWTTAGGDYVATAAATKSHTASDVPGWDSFDVSSIVSSWVGGGSPNHGFLLRATDETVTQNKSAWLSYYSDDYGQPSLRPKLAVTYSDPSAGVVAPTAAISAPAAGDRVRNTVDVVAAASDDRRVDKVEFLVDGALKSTDTTAPYSFAWDTKTAANGNRSLTARATDDAGNAKTSAAVTVEVANSAPPTTRVTSPSTRYDDLVKGDNPAVYWRLGEAAGAVTAADSSGNARSGSYGGDRTNGVTGLLTGDADKAASMLNQLKTSTVDGRVSAGLSGLFGAALTAEAWVSYSALATNGTENRVWSRNWGTDGGWRLSVARNGAGQQVAEFAINKAGAVTTTSSVVTAGKLHLAGTYDGATMRLYVNGQQTASAALVTALNSTATVFLGQSITSTTTLDDAALYARAVSAQELRAHYDAGSARPVTISGTHTVQAAAADDGSVSKVEFYVDGNRFGEDASAPYSAPLSTLGAEPVYDGGHVLTTRAYDNHGQVTTSADTGVVVANASGTKYVADVASTPVPQAVTYDPAASAQDKHGLDVTVTNRSQQTWSDTDVVVRPRWLSPDPTVQSVNGAEVPLGAPLAPGASKTVRVLVEAPALPAGVEKAQYRLQVDLFERSTTSFFADKGNKPLENPVIVNKALLTGLGLEKWWQYDAERLGGGMQHLVNVANGNSLVRWTPFSAPGRGLSTVVDITYNSLEKKSESPIGNNFSLSVSGLTRFGNPIDIHPNKADEIAGRANRFVEITDGDGTTHRFIGKQAADGSVYWEEPAGVHLYLRSLPEGDARGRWALTRPDRVTFFYDADGYPLSVQDPNRNALRFTLEDTPPSQDPGGPKKRITAITDAGGRSFTITYWSKEEAKKAHVRGKVKRITDHSGSPLDFEYYDDGNLLRIIQRGGTNADGSALADRSFVFTYTTSNGDGPAIPAAADRVSPEPKTPNQSTRLFSVRDPLGRETTFEYLGPGHGQDRWKLASRSDRRGQPTTFGYDTTNRVTTVTDPIGRVTKYAYDAEGKVLSIVDALQEKTSLEWTGDRHVRKVIEPSGRFTEYDYDGNGYRTRERDQRGKVTTLEYDHLSVDAGDVAGKWKAGRGHAHISQLRRKVDPNGNEPGADPNAHDWLFEHDENGNLRYLTDPDGGKSERSYNLDGTVAWSKDENLNQTTFNRYDANGLPAQVTNAEGHVTQFFHDADGLLRWVQDPLHHGATGTDERSYRSTMDYDAFHRMGRQSTPTSTDGDRGNLVWTGARFDANDNVVAEIGAHEGRDWTGSGAITTHDYDQMDRPTLTTRPDREVDPDGERTRVVYDEVGRVKRVTEPKGVDSHDIADDHTTEYRYDPLDRVVQKLRFNVEAGALKETQKTHYCYATGTGDLKWVVSPRANADSGSCSATSAPRFAEQYEYDEAHQVLSVSDAGHGAGGATKHVQRRSYDANGNVRTQTDERGTVKEIKYNGRDLPVEEIQFLDKAAGRKLFTRYVYDAAGNRKKVISPRAVDAGGTSPTDYVATMHYDKVDRVTRIDLPKSGSDDQLYVHRRYDPNGNMVAQSLPVKAAAEPGDRTLSAISADHKTTLTYFDTGWVKTENQPGTPRVRFAYTPEGWQRSRVPETKEGVERWDRQTTWEYWVDGMLRAKKERDGQPVRYAYDANNQLTLANDTSGVDDAGADALDVEVDYDGLGRPKEVRQQKVNADRWLATKFTEYDLEDNVVERTDNREETESGSVIERGRRHRYVYDDSGWLTEQTDFGKKDASDADAHADDRRISTEFFETGWEKVRTIAKRPAGSAATADFTAVKQRTSWDYFDNGKLKVLRTRNGSDELLESHDVTYEDGDGRYVNGHRTKDVFTLRGPKDDAEAKCRDAGNPCTTKYTYNARDQLVKEQRLRGGTDRSTSYDLLPTGDVDVETLHDGMKIDNDYVGQQLRQRKVIPPSGPSLIQKYNYDLDANLSCAWEAASESEERTCASAESAGKVREKYEYDKLNRVRHAQRWKPLTGEKDDDTRYTYDALDRVVREIETHGASGSAEDRRTEFSYLGTSSSAVQETLHYTHGAKEGQTRTKTFSYDAFGNRIAMSDRPHGQTEKEYTYGHDVHGSVSLLLDERARPRLSTATRRTARRTRSSPGSSTPRRRPTRPRRARTPRTRIRSPVPVHGQALGLGLGDARHGRAAVRPAGRPVPPAGLLRGRAGQHEPRHGPADREPLRAGGGQPRELRRGRRPHGADGRRRWQRDRAAIEPAVVEELVRRQHRSRLQRPAGAGAVRVQLVPAEPGSDERYACAG
jgi:YD repeat-containing protein